ncbi:MAG: hypothetical protein AAGD14_08190 [Planctomycetota bacterium]
MRILVAVACLLGAAGLWAWAIYAPVDTTEIDPKYVGTWELFRFEPEADLMSANPLENKQAWHYIIEPSGKYLQRVFVTDGIEMSRRGGVLTEEEGNYLVFERRGLDGVAVESAQRRYFVEWGSDEEGPFLHLTQELARGKGEQLFLRRVEQQG